MFTDTVAVTEISMTTVLARRGVGRAAWKRVIDNLIASEKEDLKDLAILRRLLANNKEGQELIAQMQERKTVRVIELTQLYHYREGKE